MNSSSRGTILSVPEINIRKAIMKWLRLYRVKCWIYDSVGIYDEVKKCYRKRYGLTIGLPDIHGVLPGGRFFAIEVKTEHGYPSLAQKAQLAELHQLGAIVFVARSIKDVQDHLLSVIQTSHLAHREPSA